MKISRPRAAGALFTSATPVQLAALAALALAALSPPPCHAADAPAGVTLHYYERPPLHYTNAGSRASGFIVDKTEKIFNQAGVSYTWQVTPANRILALIKSAPGNHCAPGWYKTASAPGMPGFPTRSTRTSRWSD